MTALADDPVPGTAAQVGATAPKAPALFEIMFPFILMFGIIYFLMIRPQNKKMKQQQALLEALKPGDEVVTASGMLGKITGITDKVVTMEVADSVKIRVLKGQVSQVVKGPI